MPLKNQTSDNELMHNLSRGDLEAFDQIFSKYSDRLFGFALSYLKSKEDTENLVQDIFIKVWENRKNLKKDSSLKSYLFTIAYHDICRYFKKKQIHENYIGHKGITQDLSINMEEQLDYKSTLDQVNQLIDKLPKKQRLIFIKSRMEGKSTKEIADELNLAPGTIDNQISAALKFLRKNLSESNIALLLFFSIFIS